MRLLIRIYIQVENLINNISVVTNEHLCISCGACIGVCPVGAVSFCRTEGMYEANVSAACINCGRCISICPGKGLDLSEMENKYGCNASSNPLLGNCVLSVTTATKDPVIIEKATSGGFVTTIVQHLLTESVYDGAFLVDTDDYSELVQTVHKRKGDSLLSTVRSRYVPISHADTFKYIESHREERLIVIGTGCFVEAFIRFLKLYNLPREQYLIIGLFCDRTLTYNVFSYFSKRFGNGSGLKGMNFRDKSVNGWPGGVKLYFFDGRQRSLSAKKRIFVKDYFTPERCIYCIDKLNIFADISVGDNYTDQHQDKRGSSSAIIRSQNGLEAWLRSRDLFISYESDLEQIAKAQKMENRKKNILFQKMKQSGVLFNNVDLLEKDSFEKKDCHDYSKLLSRCEKGKRLRIGAIELDVFLNRIKGLLLFIMGRIKLFL